MPRTCETSLDRSELLKYHFRNAAQTGLMVYRNYFGEQKPLRKLQFSSEVIFNVLVEHEPDHVLLREARREADARVSRPRRRGDLAGADCVASPSGCGGCRWCRRCRSRCMQTRSGKRLLVENPAETLERLYHHWWERLQKAVELSDGVADRARCPCLPRRRPKPGSAGLLAVGGGMVVVTPVRPSRLPPGGPEARDAVVAILGDRLLRCPWSRLPG